MFDPGLVGVYGKIPAHGDFLNLNLPSDFMETWDHWLQQSILASQEVLAESWLTHFLISPVWRFVLPSGCANAQSWAGIMLPSVDKVGRYYPLTLAAPIPDQVGAIEYLSNAEVWFQWLEDTAIMTLEKGLDADELAQELTENKVVLTFSEERPESLQSERNLQRVVPLKSSGLALNGILPQLCDALLKPQASNLSLWWTEGGEHVEAALLLADQLPRPVSYTAMLNGQWANWHWPNLFQSAGG
ncbi:MAG: type VI secretion system protein ImpM [Oleiphilaceae bacterium]|jgi:type VI secretion system protein ImpM